MADETQRESIQFDVENVESWQKRVHVSVSQERMENARDDAAKKLQKHARMDGFRKGKVPLKTVRASYAGQVEQEAIESLIPVAYGDVLKKHEDIHPISEPSVENLKMEEGEPIRFDLMIEVRPELEITGYEGLEIEQVLPVIDDEKIDAAMADLAERSATWESIEGRSAEEGDALQVDFTPLDEDGKPRESEKTEDYGIELGSAQVLPEFNAALEGMQTGEDTQVEVSYPEDFPNEDLAGTKLIFHVVVKEIKAKVKPELTDEFAESNTKFSTMAELRADMEESLKKHTKNESQRRLRDDIVAKLIEINELPIPSSLEARYLQAILEDISKSSGQELNDEQREKMGEMYKPVAQRSVQRLLLLDNLRRSIEIEVTDADIEAKIVELASEQGADADEMRRAIERAKNMDRLRGDIEENKLFTFLEEQAQITVVESKEAADGETEDDE